LPSRIGTGADDGQWAIKAAADRGRRGRRCADPGRQWEKLVSPLPDGSRTVRLRDRSQARAAEQMRGAADIVRTTRSAGYALDSDSHA
jgi:hypothetical protein